MKGFLRSGLSGFSAPRLWKVHRKLPQRPRGSSSFLRARFNFPVRLGGKLSTSVSVVAEARPPAKPLTPGHLQEMEAGFWPCFLIRGFSPGGLRLIFAV